ncbi:MAG: MurR/RpiR family transcriptional regulator [Butyrivibrio sp.]|nr:MurR/RpiR family transcriptional regulator [Butyrivibrio sp.]
MTIVETKIKSLYPTLAKSEQKAADYCLKHRDDLFNFPLSELAKRSGTSEGAWMRFFKSLDYSGLKEFKKELYTEVKDGGEQKAPPKIVFKEVEEYTSVQSIADNIFATSVQAIQTTYRLFDEGSFNDAITRIVAADQINIYGIGTSSVAANDLFCKLQKLSYHVTYNLDVHMSVMTASQMGENDVAIIISDNGRAPEIVELCNIIKGTGAKIIAITKLGNTPLSQSAEDILFTTSPEIDKKSGVTSSRFAQLALVDILYTAIANRDYENVKKYLQASYDIFKNRNK